MQGRQGALAQCRPGIQGLCNGAGLLQLAGIRASHETSAQRFRRGRHRDRRLRRTPARRVSGTRKHAQPLGWYQPQMRNLGGCTETLGRAPVASAAADVEPEFAQAIQPRAERLEQLHHETPWEELATVSMAGELQVIAGFGGSVGGARLMSEQYLDRQPRCPDDGSRRIAAV